MRRATRQRDTSPNRQVRPGRAPSLPRADAHRPRRGASLLGIIAALTLLAGVLTTTPTAADADPVLITGATLSWSLNDESNSGTFNGSCNYLSAGRSDGSAATYESVDGGVSVLAPGVDGALGPIGSYADRCLDRFGRRVTSNGASTLERLVTVSGGTGERDPATGEVSIAWTGSFSVTFYGSLVPFWFSDPELRVGPDGAGALTATMGGFGSDIANPEVREPLDPVDDVVVATWSSTDTSSDTGFTAQPDYDGVVVDTVGAPQFRLDPGWGSWPQSYIDFHERTGLAGFWYSTGGLADRRKAPLPIAVAYGGQIVVPPTAPPTTPPGTTPPAAPTAPTPPATTPPGTTPTVPATPTTPTTPEATPPTTPPALSPGGSSGSDGVTISAVVPDDGTGPSTGEPGTEVLPGEEALPQDVFVWSIDERAGGVALDPIDAPASQRRFVGRLGGVTVTDTRSGAPGWSLTGQVSGFGGGVPGSYLGWEPFLVTPGAGAVAGPAVPPGYPSGLGLGSPSLLASAREGRQPGRTTVDAELELRLPGSTPAGTYRATLTLTALG